MRKCARVKLKGSDIVVMNVGVVVQVAAPSGTAQESAAFVVDLLEALAGRGLSSPVAISGGGDATSTGSAQQSAALTVEGQLERLGRYWPQRQKNLMAIHCGLVELGFHAHVPQPRGPLDGNRRVASYIRYVDPVTGQALGTTNSGSFLLVARQLQQTLAGNPDVKPARDGMRVEFDEPRKVELILGLARHLKAALAE
jgi:hypothetical protein